MTDGQAPRTVQAWQRAAEDVLRAAGVPSPGADARALVAFALHLTGAELFLRAKDQVSGAHEAHLRALLARRAAREPLQYLLGELEWGGVTLRVDGRALIPRPETEWLLHLALQALEPRAAPRVVDVGTGTGALALGVKGARPDAHVTATDLSAEALALARENAALNALDVEFRQGDLLDGLPGPFDLILSNPPYLPDRDRDAAEPEVHRDPPLALYGGPDGLDVARRLTAQAASRLAPDGLLLLELDPRNAAPLADELRAHGWATRILPDLTGRERFVQASVLPDGHDGSRSIP